MNLTDKFVVIHDKDKKTKIIQIKNLTSRFVYDKMGHKYGKKRIKYLYMDRIPIPVKVRGVK